MTEVRNLLEPVEVHGEGGRLVAHGYAARFDKLSQNLGGFVERIKPGAFKKTLKEADIRALFNHDPHLVLGRNTSGTLRLSEDSEGLAYEIDLPDTSVGRDVAVLLERGDVSGSSFGFRVIEDAWDDDEDDFPRRTLKQVALRDVGPVTFPAYVDASSAIRSLAEARSLNFDALAAAANANQLSEALRASDNEDEDQEDDGRADLTIIRRRFYRP